jgi:hypothetical protein
MVKKSLLSFIPSAFLTLAAVSQPAWSADPIRTHEGRITALEAGWGADSYSVHVAAPLVNPAGCAYPEAGYVTSPTDPGRRLYQDILRDAFWHNYPVELLISATLGDCPFGKPRLISVLIRRP